MTRTIAEESRFAADYRFAATHPGVIRERPARVMNRTELHRQLNDQCNHDSGLHQSLLEHPRAIYAVAVEECLGVHRSLFFVQISHVEVVEEDAVTLGIVLTTCHLACVAPRLPTGDEHTDAHCHICNHGETQCSPNPEQPPRSEANRTNVRAWIQDRAKADEKFRKVVLTSPSAAWTKVRAELDLQANHPLNRIREVRVFVESAETIGFVREFEQADASETQPAAG